MNREVDGKWELGARGFYTRRGFLQRAGIVAAAVPVGGLLAACEGDDPDEVADADGSQPEVGDVTVTQAVTSLAFIQNFVARDLGFFDEEGLSVEIVDTGGGGPDVAAVLGGDAEFTINDGAQVLPALAEGQELRALMATLDRNIINVTMRPDTAEELGVGPDSAYEDKIAALEGLQIGITGPGALTWQMARFNLQTAGLDPDTDAEVVGLGGGGAVLAGLEEGQVDVIYISVPLGEIAVDNNNGVTLIDNALAEDPTIPSFMMEGLWAQPGFVDENPNTVQAMVNGLKRASDHILATDTDDLVETLDDTFDGFGPEVLGQGVDKVREAIAGNYTWTPEALEVTQEILQANDALQEPIGDLDEFFIGDFL